MKRHLVFLLSLAVATACTDTPTPDVTRGGTVVIATTGDADALFPPVIQAATARQVTELVYDYLTEVTPSLNTFDDKTFATRLAKSWDWSADSMALAVHLQPNARWHDGRPVRSEDVVYSFRVYTDTILGSATASQLVNIDSVTTSDSVTAVFWFHKRYPLQFYDATSQMQILPKHIFGSIRTDSLREAVAAIKPVGSGRYKYASWKRGESIELVADSSNYRGAPKLDRVIWRIFQSPDVAAQALLAGDVDVYDAMRPETVKAAATNPNVQIRISDGADYAFMAFNLDRPLFASRELRRALTMAVDRDAMTRNVFDSLALPAVGPTIASFPSTDKNLKQIPFDPAAAARVLDSLGWQLDEKSSVRFKGGRELRFRILLPTTSKNRMRMGVLVQEQLRKVGVAAKLDPMDFNAFGDRLNKHDFETAMHAWHLGTSPASIRVTWTSEGAVRDGSNFGHYRSPTFDAYVDSALTTFDPEKSRSYYNRAYQTAIDDAPAIWLYEPKLVLGLHKRIRTAPYRPDAWWYSLSDWSIPANEQIPRDRVK